MDTFQKILMAFMFSFTYMVMYHHNLYLCIGCHIYFSEEQSSLLMDSFPRMGPFSFAIAINLEGSVFTVSG